MSNDRGLSTTSPDDFVNVAFADQKIKELQEENSRLQEKLKLADSLEQEKRRLQEELTLLKDKLAQEENDKALLPPALRSKLETEQAHNIALAKEHKKLTADILQKKEKQALLVVGKHLASKKLRKKLSDPRMQSYPSIHKKLFDERKAFEEKQTALNKERSVLANGATPRESIQLRDAREEKIQAVAREKEAENTRYKEALQPAHKEFCEWVDQARPICTNRMVGKWLDNTRNINSGAEELQTLFSKQKELQQKLGIPVPDDSKVLKTFGGARLLRYQLRAKLSAKERKELDNNFYDAILRNNLPLATTFLDRGADIDTFRNKLTPLQKILDNGDEKNIQWNTATWLIQHGSDPNQRALIENIGGRKIDKGATPLILLGARWILKSDSDSSSARLASVLIQFKADINAQTDIAKMTALHYAAGYDNNESSVMYLVKEGAKLDIQNSNGSTPAQLRENLKLPAIDVLTPQIEKESPKI